ncbi:hypothetical protein [Paenibacillus ottowii]
MGYPIIKYNVTVLSLKNPKVKVVQKMNEPSIALSYTIQLDEVLPHRQLLQNVKMELQELLEHVFKSYPESIVQAA